MFRFILFFASLFAAVSTANAHFVFVVPDKEGHAAKVILSESLQPDEAVPIDIISGTQLNFTDAAGHASPLKLEKAEHAFTIDLPANASGVIYGVSDLGVSKRGDSKPGILTYYPKAILGDPFDAKTRLGDHAPMELIPTGAPGKLKFLFLFGNKPVADAEVDLVLPDGTDQKVSTDKNGETPELKTTGRYGAWARHVETTAGELNGKHYDEVRKYATLVIDIPPVVYARLPQAASSFGAVASDGWLYVYGGHTADTHEYSTESVSGQFHRLNLSDHKTWEELPSGPALQGMNLAVWHGKIYRVGGMMPRNKAGEPSDIRSVVECACFDPSTKQWTDIASMPEPRSSHDLAVVGDKLIVVGGWNLTGDADNAKWLDSALVMDLSVEKPKWESVKAPFERRALIAASYQNKIYVIGGFDAESNPIRHVDIYDPASSDWSTGPDLPGPDQNGFGPAACTLDGKLYVSVADGSLYQLDPSGKKWERIAKTTPRIVHRLAPSGPDLLIIGGAAKQKQLDLIEKVDAKSLTDTINNNPPTSRPASDVR